MSSDESTVAGIVEPRRVRADRVRAVPGSSGRSGGAPLVDASFRTGRVTGRAERGWLASRDSGEEERYGAPVLRSADSSRVRASVRFAAHPLPARDRGSGQRGAKRR